MLSSAEQDRPLGVSEETPADMSRLAALSLLVFSLCPARGVYQCTGTLSQSNVDLDKLLGSWYALEIVQHRERSGEPEGRLTVDSCPELTISRPNPSRIRLVWVEKLVTIEYGFYVESLDRPGYWATSGAQNGSIYHVQYSHFAGSVEVTKAVGTHMVLTFCSPGSQLYSIVMARKTKLPRAEINGVHKMLLNRGFSIYSIKEACQNSASTLLASSLVLITLLSLFL